MKKIAIFILFYAICSTGHAEKFSLSIKAGLNTVFGNTLKGDTFNNETHSMNGYTFGGVITDSLAENYCIGLELLYTQRGYYAESFYGTE